MQPLSAAFTIATSAVELVGTEFAGWVLYNNGDDTIYIGASSVTTSTGLPVEAGEYFSPPRWWHDRLKGRSASERLYAISADSEDVRLLYGWDT